MHTNYNKYMMLLVFSVAFEKNINDIVNSVVISSRYTGYFETISSTSIYIRGSVSHVEITTKLQKQNKKEGEILYILTSF